MRVALYARVSTSHQVEHQTLEQQVERLIAHVRRTLTRAGTSILRTCSGPTATAAPLGA
ncbi:hypothetical protein [Methylobacterium isbiliense]|jgi:DNA invertase Pin-like site-specific DNA recombinase|uniref:Resolvase/invertase-type recombinase catalytic domain-containing protein n=1 Tax=Methylobacterium isbiliense TaxID=315478 RepID=A0ABQ4SBZ4_9HYPH|nr:hypothetical protein [Methylobacterium isbiliense]MDN3627707.1 hypothetical protein [Methylobacterium isbiliense]GJD99964.1 hypothetical protein GMJLKIPL_1882 [Methylobacterium isbiliense]